MIKCFKLILPPLLFVVAGLIPAESLKAQSNEFRIANQYMQQQNYQEALPILKDLHEQYPSAYTYFERYIDCLVNLKKYDEAVEVALAKLEDDHNVNRTTIKLAEVYHLQGDKTEAMEMWNRVISENPTQIQLYHNVGSSMVERREYRSAIDLYKKSRSEFNNPGLFSNELANAFMQAGMFEEAVREYYEVIKETPHQMSFVQQRFLRMRDDALYNIASLELEDFLLDMEMEHQSYAQLYQLLSWLLLETEEYRRAFVFARQYESRTPETNYSLFSLGNRLRSARQYELAADAYNYYIESEASLTTRATEEKAITYLQWGRYLEQHGLESPQKRDDLFEETYSLSESIIRNSPNYNRAERVLTTLIDLSLDHYKDVEKAKEWLEHLSANRFSDGSGRAYALYAEGRVALFNGDYTSARQSLTRADRATEDSNLSEKTRYYLSLSDFFSGDYEFATIQLRSLERRSTSYFANNAIQLKMWINNGQRIDTTGAAIKQFSESLRLINIGKYDDALEHMRPILDSPSHPFADDLTVELTKQMPFSYQPVLLQYLEKQVADNRFSPLRERLMWERAVISERLLAVESGSDTGSRELTPEEHFFQYDPDDLSSASAIEEMYEDILLEFPGGFYARFAREKLQQTPIPAQTL